MTVKCFIAEAKYNLARNHTAFFEDNYSIIIWYDSCPKYFVFAEAACVISWLPHSLPRLLGPSSIGD